MTCKDCEYISKKVKLLETENMRLAKKKSGKDKYSSFVWFFTDNHLGERVLGCGYFIQKTGDDAVIKKIYPTPVEQEFKIPFKEMMAISNVSKKVQMMDRTVQLKQQYLLQIKALVERAITDKIPEDQL